MDFITGFISILLAAALGHIGWFAFMLVSDAIFQYLENETGRLKKYRAIIALGIGGNVGYYFFHLAEALLN